MKYLAILYMAVAVFAAPQLRQIPELPADLPGGVNSTNPGPPADLPQPPADLPGGVTPPPTNSTQPPADLPGGISPPDTGNSTQPQPPSDLPGGVSPPADLPGIPGGGGGAENGTGSDQGNGGGLPIPGSPIVSGGSVVQLVQLPVHGA